jgi:protein tyrosine/serine phosphatase
MKPNSCLLAVLLVALTEWSPADAQTPAQVAHPASTHTEQPAALVSAPRVKLPGLPRFGTVDNQLYRGGQPQPAGFAELKKMGIGIVVNFRHEGEEIARERALVEQQGLRYVSIPWRGKQDPRTEQVVEFLELLRANPDAKVFVHCERGSERTGVMVACYRMSRNHWTPDQALNEMEAFGFRGMRFGHLKKYVRAFPSLLGLMPSATLAHDSPY